MAQKKSPSGKTIYEHAQELFDDKSYSKCIAYLNEQIFNLDNQASHLPYCLYLLGRAYLKKRELEKALRQFQQAALLKPDFASAYYNIGYINKQLGHTEKSIEAYQLSLKYDPKNLRTLLNIAAAYRTCYQSKVALTYYEKMLEIDPLDTRTYRNLGQCLKYSDPNHPHIQKIYHALSQPEIKSDSVMQGHFALGKIYKDCHLHELAFAHFQISNTIKYMDLPLDSKGYTQRVERIKHVFNQEFMSSPQKPINTSSAPIFIIGLSRSGKTTLEGLIAQHPHIFAAEELGHLDGLLDDLPKLNKETKKYPEGFKILPEIDKEKFAQAYLRRLTRDLNPQQLHATDTTPSHFRHIGLIHYLFPKAQIIHCKRNPLDHILQIYFKYYARGNSYAYNLNVITHYYALYHHLMNYWSSALKIPILDVQYEQMVKYPIEETNRVLKYLELTPISTADFRCTTPEGYPLNDSEVNMYQPYEHHLDLVKVILKKYNIDF